MNAYEEEKSEAIFLAGLVNHLARAGKLEPGDVHALEGVVHAGQTAWRNRFPTDSKVMRDDYAQQILQAHTVERLAQVGAMVKNAELAEECTTFLRQLYQLKEATLKETK